MMDEQIFNITYVAIYVVILLIMLRLHQRKCEHAWGVGSIILLSYLFYPIIGALWFFNENGTYRELITELQLLPFIYLAAMLYIGLYPVLKYDRNDITSISQPPMLFLNVFVIIYGICALMYIPTVIENLSSGLTLLFTNSDAGQDMYRESQVMESSYDGSISNIPSIIFNIFSPLIFFLFFYFLTLGKGHLWAEVVLGICILIQTFASLSNGQRTEATMSILKILIAYWTLRPMLSDGIKKVIRTSFVILGVAVAIPFMAITFSRFGEDDGGVLGSLYYYIGQAPYYFDEYAFEPGELREGDRTANIFKQFLFGAPNGIFEVRAAHPNMLINDHVFSSYVGDFCLDFGPLVTAVLFIFFSFFTTLITQPSEPNTLPFHRLVLVYFAMTVCFQGGFHLFSYSFAGNLQIVAIFIFYLIFAIYYRHHRLLLTNKPNEQ